VMCRCPSPTTNLIIPATLATAAAATNHCTFLPASQPPHVASGSTDRTRVSAMQEHAPALYPRDATLALCQLRPGVCLSVCLSSQVVVPSKCLDGSNWFFCTGASFNSTYPTMCYVLYGNSGRCRNVLSTQSDKGKPLVR